MGYNTTKVRAAILNKWDWEKPSNNIPILVWGPPGVGKTYLIMSIAAERKIFELQNEIKKLNSKSLNNQEQKKLEKYTQQLDRLQNYTNPDEIEDILEEHILVMRLAERPIEQIEGVPAPNFEQGFTKFLMPENLVYLKKASWVVVFLDELDKASSSKMAAVTHLIENRRVGDFCLPKDTFVIAAANRTQDSFLSKPVSPELCNRMAHIELDADIDTWVGWAEKHNVSQDVINFHKFNKMRNDNYLVRFAYDDNEASSPRAFASPRSWYHGDKLRRKIYQINNCKYGEKDDIDQLATFELEQMIGEQCAIEFVTYLKIYCKIDIMKILNGEQKIPTLLPSQTNRETRDNIMVEQYIYAFAIIEQLRPELINTKNAMKNLVEAISAMVPEIRVVFIRTISVSNNELIKKIANSSESEKLLDEIIAYISE